MADIIKRGRILKASGASVRFDHVEVGGARPGVKLCMRIAQPRSVVAQFVKAVLRKPDHEIVQVFPTWDMLWEELRFYQQHDPRWNELRLFLLQGTVSEHKEWSRGHHRLVIHASEGLTDEVRDYIDSRIRQMMSADARR